MKKAHFTTANNETYADPISPEDSPSKPTSTGGVSTKSSTEAATGNTGTITTAPTIDLFKSQETMR